MEPHQVHRLGQLHTRRRRFARPGGGSLDPPHTLPAAALAIVLPALWTGTVDCSFVYTRINRNGLETNPVFFERAKYVADHVGLWRLAWFTWSIAAVAILYFFASFVWAHRESLADPADARRFALLLATVAVAADLAAEAIEIGVLPGWAQRVVADGVTEGGDRSSANNFCALHRTSVMLSGYLANGLYSVSAVILALGTRSRYPRWVWWSGIGVGLSGLTLSGASLLDWVGGMFWSNVFLVPLILVWLAGVGLSRSASRPC